MTKKSFNITGMCCDNCVKHVSNALKAIPQIKDMHVQIAEPQVVVDLEGNISSENIIEVINNAGHYTASEAEATVS